MASIKELKKDINHTLGDLIGECYAWELDNPKASTKKSDAIIDEAIETFDTLVAKIHQKDVENKKAHFRSISVELKEKADAIAGKISKLK